MSNIFDDIRGAIVAEIADAKVVVTGDGRHFNLEVTSAAFEGKNTLGRHRLVMGALREIMAGEDAQVHAIDSLKTHLP